MARFDLHERPEGDGYYLDCQSHLLRDLTTRFVVPVLKPEFAPKPAGRLNPSFVIDSELLIMVTQFAGTIPRRELKPVAGSLIDHDVEILAAIDVLVSGY